MLEVEKWAEDKDPIIKWLTPLSVMMILSAQVMSEAFPKTKSRYHPAYKFPVPHLRSWFAMYRSHRRTNEQMKGILAAIFGTETVDGLVSSFDIIMKLKRLGVSGQHPVTLTPDESLQVMQSLELLRSLVENTVKDRLAYGKFKTSGDEALAKLYAEKPLECSYLFFVYIPCFFTYQTQPTKLYRQARQGDFEALKKLLSLDQLLFQNTSLGKWIIEYRFNHSPLKFKKLLNAAYTPQKGANVYLSVVRYISGFFSSINKPLTAQDMIEFIAAIDEDAGTNFLAEITNDPRSLGKELQPSRNRWRDNFKTDIKK